VSSGPILAIDLATAFGWAEGVPGETPRAGSARFAKAGSSDGAVGSGALQWAADYFAFSRPKTVFIERPGLHSVAKGKSSAAVIQRLLGLCFLVQTIAYRRGIYDVRFVQAGDVRKHFLGSGRMDGARAKKLVAARCQALGWEFKNPDESDALALWSYGCETVEPGSGHGLQTGSIFDLRRAAR
jgi:hypothetical protein